VTIALVSTGGTIAMVGRHPYDWVDYAESGQVRGPDEILRDLKPYLPEVAIEAVPFRSIGSTGIVPRDWCELAALAKALAARDDVAGIVITHGTATLEESAWFLQLTVETEKPIVLTGAQRPPNTVGSDAAANLRAALLVAQSEEARGLGVLVVMASCIYDARSVSKLSNHDLTAFDSLESGPLGRVLADGQVRLRQVPRPLPVRTWSTPATLELPRVEITYSYAGNDGTAVRAFVERGVDAIVCAGLPPGRPANLERETLREAVRAGVTVALSSRAKGAVESVSDAKRDGFLIASDLGPLKTRILLMLALTATRERDALQSVLDRF
jgi:L-asparaginase